MHHQDWEPVVIGKKKQQQTSQRPPQPPSTMSASANKPAWKIEQQVDAENGKPLKYVDRGEANAIVKARVAMRLSQKDVAMRLNLQTKDINDIESGKAVENRLMMSKIKRLLQIK